MHVVLHMQFISMDQIEKQSFALFSGGNSKFSAYYGHSYCFDDISDRFIPHRTYNNESLKGEDSNKCSECWNFNINRAKYSR